MNWIERLRAVRIVVCHTYDGRACHDGRAAAILVHDAMPRAEIVFAGHGGGLDSLPVQPGVMFVDLAPPESREAAWLEAGALVLDHHETRRDCVERFVACGQGYYGLNELGESGAMLAFTHVWSVLRDEKTEGERSVANIFAELAAVRDTWKRGHRFWDEACKQAAALTFYPWRVWGGIVRPFGKNEHDDSNIDEWLAVGEHVLARRHEESQALARTAISVRTRKGTNVSVINSLETSDVAELLEADVLVGFQYRQDERGHERMDVSFRSRGQYDVGALAKRYAGGGHRSAAGAVLDPHLYYVDYLDRDRCLSPTSVIVAALDAHEAAA